jgi:phosphatidylglycerol:prolipoprotein diacylglycerol transferase
LVHVVANISFYLKDPAQIPLIWHGGLSSFGGLAGAIPTAIYFKRRYAPSLSLARAFDLVAPVLISAWALGRILGPQLMYPGGGRPTNAWYGLQYAGQVGYRIPVPIFQALEDFVIFLIVLQIEKRLRARAVPLADGTLAFTALLLWSMPRFWDEYFWLAVPKLWDAVEVFSLMLIAASIIALVVINRPRSATPKRAPVGAADEAGS